MERKTIDFKMKRFFFCYQKSLEETRNCNVKDGGVIYSQILLFFVFFLIINKSFIFIKAEER